MSAQPSFRLELDGKADMALIERALDDANRTFNGANVNSAISFAVTFLTSMIVIYERATDQVGEFDVDELTATIENALDAMRNPAESHQTLSPGEQP